MRTVFLILTLLVPSLSQRVSAANQLGLLPLHDLGPSRSYQGAPGGLYPGSNTIPGSHLQAGLAEAARILPRNCAGTVDPTGTIGFVSIGMSNTSLEWRALINLARRQEDLNPEVTLIDGALAGQTASSIADPNAFYWDHLENVVSQEGLSPLQVQAAWFLEANASPRGGFPSATVLLRDQERSALQNLRSRFPNLRIVFMGSRIYAGYATTPLNPEPYAYESGFAVKWLIEDQIDGDPGLNHDPAQGPIMAPWIDWGAYTWADGLQPRSDGLIWTLQDYATDGTHPSDSGSRKVARLLLDAFRVNPTSRWLFRQGASAQSSLSFPRAACNAPPPAPYSLSATVLGRESLQLEWASDLTPDLFRIEIRTATSEFATALEVDGNVRSAEISGLQEATWYEIRAKSVTDSGVSTASEPAQLTTDIATGPCLADDEHLCLAEERFRTSVIWQVSRDRSGSGRSQSLTPDSGIFSFFDPANLELLVKLLDGRSTNAHYWFFYGSATNVEFFLTVSDTLTGESRTYHNLRGEMASEADIEAFPE